MQKCAKCGADTILFVNGVPLCVKCDSEIEEAQARKKSHGPASDNKEAEPERRTTLMLYGAAVRRYQQDVRDLKKAAGSLEYDAYLWLHQRCAESGRTCAQLRESLHRMSA